LVSDPTSFTECVGEPGHHWPKKERRSPAGDARTSGHEILVTGIYCFEGSWIGLGNDTLQCISGTGFAFLATDPGELPPRQPWNRGFSGLKCHPRRFFGIFYHFVSKPPETPPVRNGRTHRDHFSFYTPPEETLSPPSFALTIWATAPLAWRLAVSTTDSWRNANSWARLVASPPDVTRVL